MDYQKRLYALAEILEEDSIDAILVENPIDIYYLTGICLSTGKLVVHRKGTHLIVDGRYIEACSDSKLFTAVLLNPDIMIDLLLGDLKHIKSLAFISDKTTYQRFLDLETMLEKVVENDSKREIELIPTEDFVLQLRSVKDPKEIRLLEEAAELGSKGYDYICTILKEGITEEQIVRELDIFWMKHGAEDLAFAPIIAFGPGSSRPHYKSQAFALKKGMPVLIDIGVKLNGYHSDMTRVVFYDQPDSKMEEIYEVVRGAQEAALKLCKPGTRVGDIDIEARVWIADRGYGENFTHGLGHGVGLEVHELPVVRSATKFDSVVLQPGMCITIEPGIYLPKFGGVRIEDTVIITENGHIDLTKRPKELLVINS